MILISLLFGQLNIGEVDGYLKDGDYGRLFILMETLNTNVGGCKVKFNQKTTMSVLNADCPYFKVFVRRSYYTHNPKHDNIFDEAVAFGVQSVTNRILTFHCMWDFGMVRSRVPLSALYWKIPEKDIEPHFKVLWDCFSENVSVTQFEYLKGKRCQITLKDKSVIWATYFFTVDWYSNSFSDDPSNYKNIHVFFADDGYLVGQPNNRMEWKDQNWVTNPFPVDKKEIKVDKEFLRVETKSDRWVSENGNCFYYDINNK
jgi:hypothetical protein